MTYTVEVMLRNNEQVFTETIHHIGGEDPAAWTTDDASTVLHTTLLAIDRVLNPGRTDEPAALTFRGKLAGACDQRLPCLPGEVGALPPRETSGLGRFARAGHGLHICTRGSW